MSATRVGTIYTRAMEEVNTNETNEEGVAMGTTPQPFADVMHMF